MRILLSKDSKKELLNHLKLKHSVNSLLHLSTKLDISKNTLGEWFYNPKRYLPSRIIPKEIKNKLEILDEKEKKWGNIKGGKKTYQIILERYGIEEIKKRQSKGGKNSAKVRIKEGDICFKIDNPLFLEFYGMLLGDGWIGRYRYKNKLISLIGISGDAALDKEYHLNCQKIIFPLFNRKGYLKNKKGNSIELQISHKRLLSFLNEDLEFPLGKKGVDLKICDKIFNLDFNKLKYVVRGIFDTDGSFYLDKTPVGRPYPCISIQMKAPILINQLYKILIDNGFKVVYRKNKNMITLKGTKQLKKWMKEIGSSNQRHLRKINALVAQSG